MGNSTQAITEATKTVSTNKTGNTRKATGSETTEIDRLRFELLRSALYHDMRQATLKRINSWLMFLLVLLGSGAIAAFGATWPVAGQAAGAAVAVLSAAALIWDFGGAAKDHAELRRRFYGLLADAEGGAGQPEITKLMTLIYADEPPMIARVNIRAHDRAGRSIYGDDFQRAKD